jgi:DNA invertase Pin-like site-specific DNA recombinase
MNAGHLLGRSLADLMQPLDLCLSLRGKGVGDSPHNLKAGDTLIVVKLDRLGRSTRDVLNLVHELDQKGAALRVLEPDISTAGPMGKVMMTVLGMVAEMELGFIKERQKAGIEKAKAEGVYKGRPVTLDHEKIKALHAEGMGATELARRMGCSRGAIYKALGQREALRG